MWKLIVCEERVSTKFHYLDENNKTLCTKDYISDFFQTDLKSARWNIKTAYKEGYLCKRCLKKLLKEKTLDEILGGKE